MGPWVTILLLMLLGFILLLIELFIIPGFGIAGIAGIAVLASSCYLAFTKSTSLWQGWVALLGILIIIIIFVKLFPMSRTWKKLQLSIRETGQAGFNSAPTRELEGLAGKTGVSLTMLRPAGTAKIEGKRVDVITEGIFVPKDTKITVVAVKANKVIVRKE